MTYTDLYIIPARGGSKGIPNKNIVSLKGKALIDYSIDIARQLAPDSHICVSTDSEKIKKHVEDYGLHVPFLRPSDLATDTATSSSLVQHALEQYKHLGITRLILLQATSPLRTNTHIKEALNLYSPHIDMVMSVSKSKKSPYFSLFEENKKGFLERSKKSNITRRQDSPDIFEANGSIYIINPNSIQTQNIENFKKVKGYIMDDVYSIDIDSPLDLKICEALMY